MLKSVLRNIGFGVAALGLAWGASASAASIDYIVTGLGDGTLYTDGSDTTVLSTFVDLPFRLDVIGDTTTYFENAGVSHGVFITGATITANGKTSALAASSTTRFFDGESAYLGLGGFLDGVKGDIPYVLSAPQFDGYSGWASIGPFSVTVLSFGDLEEQAGPDFVFSTISGATFAASVPEPSTWGMMVMGLIGVGWAVRIGRRRLSLFGMHSRQRSTTRPISSLY